MNKIFKKYIQYILDPKESMHNHLSHPTLPSWKFTKESAYDTILDFRSFSSFSFLTKVAKVLPYIKVSKVLWVMVIFMNDLDCFTILNPTFSLIFSALPSYELLIILEQLKKEYKLQ